MRETRFRGKRVDTGQWVYGYLFKIWERTYILWGTTNGVPNMIEVNSETIGQYTGLKDKNGVEIYEGDIVKVKIQAGYSEHFVDKERILPVKYLVDVACWSPFTRCRMWRDENGTLKAIEVIGNIHENPELLEVER